MHRLRALYDRVVLEGLNAFVTILVALHSLVTRQRMSHENGITARGRLRIVDDPKFPPHPFFAPGREFPCRLRHASVSYLDDAALVVRGTGLKFADEDRKSPLDLLMNTGETAPFYDAWTFVKFMYLTIRGRDPYALPYLRKYPMCARGIQVSLRRNPESFADLRYWSKTPFEYRASDGKLRYVKFRMIPADDRPETGIPSDEEIETPWDQRALPGETRSPNYLKREFKERVEGPGVRYRVQMQLHEPDPGDRREELLNACIAWDHDVHPWLDLAEVQLDEVLSYEAGNSVWFTPSNHPDCISYIAPRSIHDPPSLERLRRGGIWARRARLLGYRLFGMPDPPPEERALDAATAPSAAALADVVLAPQTLLTPAHDTGEGREQRSQELERTRAEYQWRHDEGMPPYVRELPAAEAFDDEEDVRMLWDISGTVLDLGLGALDKVLDRNGKWEISDFDWLYVLRDKPSVSRRFRSDAEFGRQRLDGVNPVLIERCQRIPDHFPVNDGAVAGLLGEHDSLEAAGAEGRLYLLDYKSLVDTPAMPGRYLTAPLCLLYRNARQQIVPIAIQLGQSPDAGPLFTPRDPPWLWLTARTFVQSADAHFHEVTSHLLRTHLAMEPFAITTARQLSARHPIHALLKPHFRDTLAINHGARTNMLAPGGAIDVTMAAGTAGCQELMKRGYRDWRFDETELKADLRARGVEDPELLPGYHYRDDSLVIHAAIDEFVAGVIARSYPSDRDVAVDTELQGWARKLASPTGGNVRGLPGDGVIASRALLQRIITEVVFTCSAEHASVDNGQYELFGYPPNVPGALYAPPPRTRDELSEEILVKMLPERTASAQQLGMVHLLSAPTTDPLGDYATDAFVGDPVVEERAARFRRHLGEISEQIQKRNEGLEVPYTYLDPRQVAQSIAV